MAPLVLAACAPGTGERDERDSAPIGYELALAKGDTLAAASQKAAVIDLTVEQLRAKLDAGGIRLIDVRTAEEVAEATIPGAEHIALDKFDPARLDLDDRELVLYCRSGRRSGIAAERLAEHTGQPAKHLVGGILAWEEAGEPVDHAFTRR
ncbi:MAG: rhodanese-like domain-containing protein [Erythrobacter sp.]